MACVAAGLWGPVTEGWDVTSGFAPSTRSSDWSQARWKESLPQH
jgi:hypothetical protein